MVSALPSRLQELWSKSCRKRELAYFYSRCRCIGSLKERAVLPWETDCPSGKSNISSTRVGAAAGLLLSQFPLCPITNATLESKGSLETIGFKRRFLHTFCCCWQKVCRRRHKKLLEKQAAGDKQNAPFNNYPYNPLSIFQFVIMPSAAPAGPYRGNSPPLPRGS